MKGHAHLCTTHSRTHDKRPCPSVGLTYWAVCKCGVDRRRQRPVGGRLEDLKDLFVMLWLTRGDDLLEEGGEGVRLNNNVSRGVGAAALCM